MRSESSFYLEAFKWKVVQAVLLGKLTKEEALKVYGIKSMEKLL